MASRQVTLLTRGYLTGRLDFQYKQPFSLHREQFILNEIEKELYKEFLVLRAQTDSALLSSMAGRSREAFEAPQKVIKAYSELVLPYHAKKATIDKDIGIKDKDHWVQFLKKRKESLDIKK